MSDRSALSSIEGNSRQTADSEKLTVLSALHGRSTLAALFSRFIAHANCLRGGSPARAGLALLAFALLALTAGAQTVVFNDTFGAGSVINSNPTSPAAPLIDRTAYQQISAKSFNPNPPTIAAGHLRYGIVGTSSGFSSIEALFTQFPVTLVNVGEYIEMTVVFTNQAGIFTANPNGTLLFALHNGGQTQPVPGGLNGTSDTYAMGGNAQSWAGYISRILYTGGNHQICSRAAQGAVARCQDVLYNFNNPSATTIGSLTASTLGALAVGSQYTQTFRITKTAAAAVTIASTLYSGPDTSGTQLFTQSVVSSSIPVSTIDALAIGYRHTGSVASVMDVNSIKVVTTASTTVVPVITTQPASQTVSMGDPVTLSVVANGGGAALTYQWEKDGADIAGATNSSHTIASTVTDDAGNYTVVVTDAAGSTTSDAATLTVTTGNVPPTINSQPSGSTVLAGSAASFTCAFSGTAPLSAQWEKSTDNGANYINVGSAGPASPFTYSIASAALSDAGLYRLVVTNPYGSATSNAVTLTVNEAPMITTQPVGATLAQGADYMLSVVATGTPAPTYQWRRNGSNISGATSASYTITGVSGANAGAYSCVATNSVGSATSDSVYVGVLSPTMNVASVTPASGAIGKNRDVLLKITFNEAVTIGTTGRIRVYDSASPGTPVDTIDLSTAITVTQFGTPYRYMAKTVGGANFNYLPVTVSGNTATIALHSSTVLSYGKTYFVTIEPGVLLDATGATFGGISGSSTWSFTTKAAGPVASAASIFVAADGSADFDTVQGAVDFVPYSPANTIPRTIHIANGTYNEIVRLRSGQNLVTMQGQSRAGVVIQYLTNNNTLISGAGSIGQRSVFGVDPNDFTIQHLTVRNATPQFGSQAEAFWVGNNALRTTIYDLNILSFQDTFMSNGGQAFITDCYVEGDVDFIWGSGKTFFQNSELKMMLSGGIYAQARNSSASFPGYFFYNCQLTSGAGVAANSAYLARIDPAGNPHSQVVWMNCRMGPHIIASAWQLNNATTAPNVKFWESQSVALDGSTPIDVSGRPTYNNIPTGVGGSTVLANQQIDAPTAAYSSNAMNAIGWAPVPVFESQPQSQTLSEGQTLTLSATASAPLAMTYQWHKNGSPISGATAPTCTIAGVASIHAGNYTVVATNPAGSTTSAVATITVNGAPYIIAQPVSRTLLTGADASFAVTAFGSAGTLSYQWFKDNSPLTGETSALLTITGATAANAGNYTVQITNVDGSVTSAPAALVVSGTLPIPAFPGAEGPGSLATGGRGGDVYHVTTLDDDRVTPPAGSLREALTTAPVGGRTIVFDVAGTIALRSSLPNDAGSNIWLRSGASNITIAGQTAPYPGITITGQGTKLTGSNVILRNVSFRPGPDKKSPGTSTNDALSLQTKNSIVDHVSASFSDDEGISATDAAENTTLQYSIISEGLNYVLQDGTSHAMGSLLASEVSNAPLSLHHNLFSSESTRNPRIGNDGNGVTLGGPNEGSINNISNNVIYNWRGRASYDVTGKPARANFLGNYFIAGPTTLATDRVFYGTGTNTRIFHDGNFVDMDKNAQINGVPFNFTGPQFEGSVAIMTTPFAVDSGYLQSATDACDSVLNCAGAYWWNRTPVDARVVHDVRTRGGRIIKSAAEVAGIAGYTYPATTGGPIYQEPSGGEQVAIFDGLPLFPLISRPAGFDTDGDGMPDAWEIAHGLNPNAVDAQGDFDNDGYTNLEEYLNELAAFPAPKALTFALDGGRYEVAANWELNWQPSHLDAVLISGGTATVDSPGQHARSVTITGQIIPAELRFNAGWLSVAELVTVGQAGTLRLAGGSLGVGTPGVVVANGGTLTGNGTIFGSLTVQFGGQMLVDGGTFAVTGNVTNNGTMRLTGGAALSVTGTFVNNGVLDLLTGSQTLPAGFVNNGIVLDSSLNRVLSHAKSGASFTITIDGYTGHTYQLERADILTGPWTPVGSAQSGTNSVLTLTGPDGATGDRRFYRISVGP